MDDYSELSFMYVSDEGVIYNNDNDEVNTDIINTTTAYELVSKWGLRMLRNDELSTLAVMDNKIVGVLYYSSDIGELHWSIAVDPEYRNQGIGKSLYKIAKTLPDELTEVIIAELIPPYTLESLVVSDGYTLVDQSNGFKVYAKRLSDPLNESAGFYPERKYPVIESNRDKVIMGTLSMYNAMSPENKAKLEYKLPNGVVTKYNLELYSDNFLINLKGYADDLRRIELSPIALAKRDRLRERTDVKKTNAETWQRDQAKKDRDEWDAEKKRLIDDGILDENGNFI